MCANAHVMIREPQLSVFAFFFLVHQGSLLLAAVIASLVVLYLPHPRP